MFNKKPFIGILVIALTMMLIVGCSDIAPNISLELEKTTPASLPEQALDNQQATANIPAHAQAQLPFIPWASDFKLIDLCSGKYITIGSTIETGCGEYNVYIENVFSDRLSFSIVYPGGVSSGYIYPGPDASITVNIGGNCTLESAEYKEYDDYHGWKFIFELVE
jgi:hypothetical protein